MRFLEKELEEPTEPTQPEDTAIPDAIRIKIFIVRAIFDGINKYGEYIRARNLARNVTRRAYEFEEIVIRLIEMYKMICAEKKMSKKETERIDDYSKSRDMTAAPDMKESMEVWRILLKAFYKMRVTDITIKEEDKATVFKRG